MQIRAIYKRLQIHAVQAYRTNHGSIQMRHTYKYYTPGAERRPIKHHRTYPTRTARVAEHLSLIQRYLSSLRRPLKQNAQSQRPHPNAIIHTHFHSSHNVQIRAIKRKSIQTHLTFPNARWLLANPQNLVRWNIVSRVVTSYHAL